MLKRYALTGDLSTLIGWKTGHVATGEPVLIISLDNGIRLKLKMTAEMARYLGRALEEEGIAAAPGKDQSGQPESNRRTSPMSRRSGRNKRRTIR